MSQIAITRHAAIRLAQRSIRVRDVDLIELIGTKVENGYLVREQDCWAAEHAIKKLIDRIRRLRGKRLVVIDGQLVTAFHASHRQQRQLVRHTPERDLVVGLSPLAELFG